MDPSLTPHLLIIQIQLWFGPCDEWWYREVANHFKCAIILSIACVYTGVITKQHFISNKTIIDPWSTNLSYTWVILWHNCGQKDIRISHFNHINNGYLQLYEDSHYQQCCFEKGTVQWNDSLRQSDIINLFSIYEPLTSSLSPKYHLNHTIYG